MKFFLIAAACFALAVAGPTRGRDYHPISVGPAIVEGEYEPISVGPAIVEGEYEPISVGPAIVEDEYEPISVGPAIVDPVVPSPASSPLVQIIVNVNTDSAKPVSVDTAPVIERPEAEPEPIDFVDNEEIEPSPVIVVEEAEVVEPVLVAPIVPVPVINVPDILN